jgi:hypothetical protein
LSLAALCGGIADVILWGLPFYAMVLASIARTYEREKVTPGPRG